MDIRNVIIVSFFRLTVRARFVVSRRSFSSRCRQNNSLEYLCLTGWRNGIIRNADQAKCDIPADGADTRRGIVGNIETQYVVSWITFDLYLVYFMDRVSSSGQRVD